MYLFKDELTMAANLQLAALIAAGKRYNLNIDIAVHASLDSTNNWCLQQTKAGKNLPFVCFAEEQMQGRGRRGKNWLMAPCNNIAMSIAWSFSLPHQQLQLLPLSIALSIAETLESFNIEHVQIKWPNDVYVRNKKIAGILIETLPVGKMQPAECALNTAKNMAVVIGIGLNYDMSTLDKKIMQAIMFTDICCEVKSLTTKPERSAIATSLLKNTVAACQNYQQMAKHNLEKFRERYDYCNQKNIEIILDDKTVLSGLAQGVNDNAELLALIDGKRRVFNSAEISVKIN